MTETDGRRWLKSKFNPRDVKLQPVESGGTGIGILDIFARTSYHDYWIELKVARFTADGIHVPFRPGQLPWIKDYVRLGGRARLIVFIPHDSGNDFAWWVFKDADIKKDYILSELTTLADGALTSKVPANILFEALFDKLPQRNEDY